MNEANQSAGETPKGCENQMSLPSKHRIRNSSLRCLKPCTLVAIMNHIQLSGEESCLLKLNTRGLSTLTFDGIITSPFTKCNIRYVCNLVMFLLRAIAPRVEKLYENENFLTTKCPPLY